MRKVAQDAAEERAKACDDLRRALDRKQQSWMESQRERAAAEAATLEARLREEANARRDAEIKARWGCKATSRGQDQGSGHSAVQDRARSGGSDFALAQLHEALCN